MIKVEHIETYGWEAAIRGMRNPMNSWEKSDSRSCYDKCESGDCPNILCDSQIYYCVGSNDLDLMKRLCKAGTDHRKFMRMIMVSCDITAPLYWWKEYDTYKVGTVANSCSTMHKIADKKFTLDDFSHEHLTLIHTEDSPLGKCHSVDPLKHTIKFLNVYREYYNNATDPEWKKRYWWQMIQLLPSSYNQRRTVSMTYENVMNMLDHRENHKLDEWREFCRILRELPHIKEIRGEDE